MISPAYGFSPLAAVNEASVVIVPLPWASSNTVPSPERAVHQYAVPKRLPLLSMIRAAYWVFTVGAVEGSQGSDRAAALGQLENGAVARGASSDVVP